MPEEKQKTKDIPLGDRKYRIGRMSARNGSWVAAQLMTKMLPGIAAKMMEAMLATPLPAGRSELSEAEFHNIQDHCLAVCSRLEMNGDQAFYMPLVSEQGTWAIKELEDDAFTVLSLTVHALIFNILPFFEGGGLSVLLSSFSDLKPLSPSS